MPISSLIIRTTTERAAEVAEVANAIEGVSVTDIQGANLVTVTETDSRQDDKKLWDQLEKIEGVIAVDAIYHNFEDLEG